MSKWLDEAKKQVSTMSARQKLAMLEALEIAIKKETGIEIVHSDLAVEFYDRLAGKYELYYDYDEEIECEDCGNANAYCTCVSNITLSA